jgi:TetR/AcrR family transcriptional regulator, transcriptional repressor for nem operon
VFGFVKPASLVARGPIDNERSTCLTYLTNIDTIVIWKGVCTFWRRIQNGRGIGRILCAKCANPQPSDMPKALPPEVRDRLLDEAEALIWRVGLNRMTVEEVAQAAGISKGAVYRFFESKEEIGAAIIARNVAAAINAQKELAARDDLSWPERLRRLLLLPVESANRNYLRHSYAGEMAATLYGPGKRAMSPLLRKEDRLITQVLKAGQRTGVFRPTNPASTARILRLAISAFFPPYQWLADPKDAVPEARAAIDFLIYSLTSLETSQRMPLYTHSRPLEARRTRVGIAAC